MTENQLEQTRRVARREAAPFVLIAVAADLLLALGSWWHDWRLYSASDWWIWLILALPALLLAIVFALGMLTGIAGWIWLAYYLVFVL